MKDDVMTAEEFFDGMDIAGAAPKAGRRSKKVKDDVFAKAKVKMVMEIYGASRSRALEIIAERDAERAALEDNESGVDGRGDEGGLMSAEEFFGA